MAGTELSSAGFSASESLARKRQVAPVISSPGAIITTRSMTFLSSRRFPATVRLQSRHGTRRQVSALRPYSSAKSAMKCSTSSGMSSARSRNGGTKIGITFNGSRDPHGAPATDFRQQILVRRGKHADIDLTRDVRRRARHLFLEHAQHLLASSGSCRRSRRERSSRSAPPELPCDRPPRP